LRELASGPSTLPMPKMAVMASTAVTVIAVCAAAAGRPAEQ